MHTEPEKDKEKKFENMSGNTKENLGERIQTALDQCKEEITNLEFLIQNCLPEKSIEALRQTLLSVRQVKKDLNQIVETLDPDE